MFWNIVFYIARLQVLYEVGFILWLLSYNVSILPAVKSSRAIRALVTVIKSLLRVKVVRVALATLRNLLDKEGCNQEMIDAGLPRLLPQVHARLAQWNDDEVSDDAKVIAEIRRSCHCTDCEKPKEKKFLVYFDIEKDLPLVVSKS